MARHSNAGARRLWAAGASLALVSALALAAEWRAAAPSAAPPGANRSGTDAPQLSASDPAPEPEPIPGVHSVRGGGESRLPFPASADVTPFLRNRPVVGSLEVDARGHWRAGPEARALFDHFYLASGLAPEETLRGWIEAEIRARLESPAREEALDALARYARLRALLRAVADWEEDLERRLERLVDLRRSALGPELAEAFFAEDEQSARVALEVRAIRSDPRLGPEEREERVAEAERSLPPARVAARRAANAPGQVRAQVEQLRTAGASEAQIFALRERELGSEAAERLRALDLEREQRRQALRQYRPLRDALARGADPEDRNAELEALRARFFPEAELERIRARDRIELETGLALP